jgi:putative transposase
MARQPRLVLPGYVHYVLLRGHNGAPVLEDAADEQAFVAALREALQGTDVQLHACALLGSEVRLLLRPPLAEALSRLIQTLGRRYVAGFNQRHGRSGTLWDGRFRAAVIEPGARCLLALRHLEALGLERRIAELP